MSDKPFTDSKGQLIVTLPIDGRKVTLRSPKGKDLKVIEQSSGSLNGNVEIMFFIISLLAVSPTLTVEAIEDMDAEDVEALGSALSTFRAFRKATA